jgi:hypothetical protein
MGEQLITFETAKLASEKGYSPILLGEVFRKSLPTQSLLQKWLREVHKIDVFCDCIGSGLYYSVIYDNNVKEDETDKVFEQENTTSYEDALEIGLQEGLKLIKNELVK